MWSTLYASPWHHPGVAWLALVVGAVLLATRLRFLHGYLLLFGLTLAADALAGAPFVKLPPALGSTLGIAFVIAGDLRFFLVVERCVGGRGPGGLALRALASALVVPVTSAIVRLAVPAVARNERLQYLVYEALFVLVALSFRFVVLPARLRAATPEARRWALALTGFVLGQYALWVGADLLILAGLDLGFALRLLPNTLYYALFLPFVYASAPAAERSC